jgi:hypothetical protein
MKFFRKQKYVPQHAGIPVKRSETKRGNTSVRWFQKATDVFEKGAFTGAVFSEQAINKAGMKRKLKAIEYDFLPVVSKMKVLELDHVKGKRRCE